MGLLRTLASASLVIVAACNALVGFSDLERVDDVDPNEVGSKDAGRDARRDVAPVEDASADTGVPPASTVCPASAPQVYPEFRPPPAAANACTPADINLFVANEARPFVEQRTRMMAQNAACAQCIFRTETDNPWGPITSTADGRNFVDFGICYRLAGASQACGEAAHKLEWCLQKVCNVCSSGSTMVECRDGALNGSGPCSQLYTTTLTACGSFTTITNTTCARSDKVVSVTCGGG